MFLSTIPLLTITQGSSFDSSPSIRNFHFTVYQMMHGVSLENQDQDAGSPGLIFADLFWIFEVDNPAKYTKE